MIKRNQRHFNWINRILDMAAIHLSYIAAVLIWLYGIEGGKANVATYFAFENPIPLLVLEFGYIVLFQYGGLYDAFPYKTLPAELWQLLKLFVACAALSVGLIFLFHMRDFSRGVMGSFVIVGYASLCIKRIIMRFVSAKRRKSPHNRKHILLVGSGKIAENYAATLRNNAQYGLDVDGYIGMSENPALGVWLGNYEQLGKQIEQQNPDEIVIALENDQMDMISELIMTCEEQCIRASIVPAYNDYLPDCATVDVVGNVKLINMRALPLDVSINRAVKRVMDIFLAALAVIVSSPIMLVAAIGVKLSGPGPILFKQVRVGNDRKPFTMYKFRSMVPNDRSDTAWSGARDSRVTRFGAIIRKLSIDELPQFFNVLKGDMSVVGPRPELPHFVQQYKYSVPRYMVKHQVKPGITGWAQVNGYRGDTSIKKRIEYDIWYIENWSLLLDIRILFKTVFGGMVNAEKNLEREDKNA